jgi:excisionase family DNA binding protein
MAVVVMDAQEFLETLRQEVQRAVTDALAAKQDDGWLDERAAALYLGVTKGALQAYVRRGQLEMVRSPVGRRRVKRSALDAWMTGG